MSEGIWVYTGHQYCPDCHIEAKLIKTPDGNYFECPQCKWSVTEEEAEEGYGAPSLEASYEDIYGIHDGDYGNDDDDDDGDDEW